MKLGIALENCVLMSCSAGNLLRYLGFVACLESSVAHKYINTARLEIRGNSSFKSPQILIRGRSVYLSPKDASVEMSVPHFVLLLSFPVADRMYMMIVQPLKIFCLKRNIL
jgi:hypothetical protein